MLISFDSNKWPAALSAWEWNPSLNLSPTTGDQSTAGATGAFTTPCAEANAAVDADPSAGPEQAWIAKDSFYHRCPNDPASPSSVQDPTPNPEPEPERDPDPSPGPDPLTLLGRCVVALVHSRYITSMHSPLVFHDVACMPGTVVSCGRIHPGNATSAHRAAVSCEFLPARFVVGRTDIPPRSGDWPETNALNNM